MSFFVTRLAKTFLTGKKKILFSLQLKIQTKIQIKIQFQMFIKSNQNQHKNNEFQSVTKFNLILSYEPVSL